MPYIPEKRREEILAGDFPATPGELNYRVSQILDQYASNHKPSYTVFSEVIGVIECVKLEFYRKVVSPYEEAKESANGPVYTCYNGNL